MSYKNLDEVVEYLSSVMVDYELNEGEVCDVLEVLLADLCLAQDNPITAAAGITWNIQKRVIRGLQLHIKEQPF